MLLLKFLIWLATYVFGIITFFLLIRKWSDGELRGVEVIGGILADLILIAVAQTSPDPTARLIAGLLIIGSFVFITTEGRIRGAMILRGMALESLEQARQVAEQDSSNIGARVMIAKSLYQLGRSDAAIEHLKAALQLDGAGYFREEKAKLEMWEEESDRRKGVGEVLCPKCHTTNRRGARVCRKCETWLSTSDEIMEWLRSGGLKMILRGWLAASVAVTAVLIALSFLSTIGVIAVSLLAAIAFLIWLLVHWSMEW